MAQEGAYQIVPDKLTGANSTNLPNYLGATKAGHGGAKYVLCYNAAGTSLAEGAIVGTIGGTANQSYIPWAVSSIGTGTGGSSAGGVVAHSVPASAPVWVQIAGTRVFSVGVAPGATKDAWASRIVPTDTSGSSALAAASAAIATNATLGIYYAAGPLNPKHIWLAQTLANAITTARGLIVDQGIRLV